MVLNAALQGDVFAGSSYSRASAIADAARDHNEQTPLASVAINDCLARPLGICVPDRTQQAFTAPIALITLPAPLPNGDLK